MSDSFLIAPVSIGAGTFVLTGAEAHHAATVVRIRPGETIELFDGAGNRYSGTVTGAGPGEVSGTVAGTLPSNEPALAVTLGCALVKQERFEWMLEKAVELGVTEIRPVITERTVVKLPDGARLERKMARWRSLVLAAVKQSRRSRIPELHDPVKLGTLDWSAYGTVIIPCMPERRTRIPECTGPGPVLLLIGPEGGFSDAEITMVRQAGGVPVTLGSRRLRSETAALAALRDLLTSRGE